MEYNKKLYSLSDYRYIDNAYATKFIFSNSYYYYKSRYIMKVFFDDNDKRYRYRFRDIYTLKSYTSEIDRYKIEYYISKYYTHTLGVLANEYGGVFDDVYKHEPRVKLKSYIDIDEYRRKLLWPSQR